MDRSASRTSLVGAKTKKPITPVEAWNRPGAEERAQEGGVKRWQQDLDDSVKILTMRLWPDDHDENESGRRRKSQGGGGGVFSPSDVGQPHPNDTPEVMPKVRTLRGNVKVRLGVENHGRASMLPAEWIRLDSRILPIRRQTAQTRVVSVKISILKEKSGMPGEGNVPSKTKETRIEMAAIP